MDAAADAHCSLRIITMNDVYQPDNFPKIKSFIDAHRTPNTLVTLPGDFLMPSLLSAIDHGKGMVEVLNAAGVDMVSIGNHEADVKLEQMHERIKESKFKWINTNMPNLPLPEGMPPLPKVERIQLPNGRSVAFLGVLTNETSLYKAGSFGDAEIEEPNACVARELKELDDVDAVVVMSHLRIQHDRLLAKSLSGSKVPLILGAHDHDPYTEHHDGVTVVKVGMDGTHLGVCDLSWPSADSVTPEVKIEVFEMKAWPDEDADMVAKVAGLKSVLDVLQEVWLFEVPETGLSSRNGRIESSSIGKQLSADLRDAFECDCCLWLSGAIRANRDYEPLTKFTMQNLQAELAFEDIAVAVKLPGHVISDTVAYSRRHALNGIEDGCFLQVDDGITFDNESQSITEICSAPIEPDRLYSVVLCPKLLDGLNELVPLTEFWASDHGQEVDEEYGMEAKQAIIQKCSFELWDRMAGPLFTQIDTNGDGKLSREEIVNWLRSDEVKSDAAIEILLGHVRMAAQRKGYSQLDW